MAMKNTTTSFSNLGSTGRSSEGIFSPVKSSANRLLSVPKSMPAFAPETIIEAADNSLAKTSTGSNVWRYLFIFLILVFLSINLVLFLIKPVSTPLSQLYDPLWEFSNAYFKTNFNVKKEGEEEAADEAEAIVTPAKKDNIAAVKKLEKVIDAKPDAEKKYKKLPVIPEADDSTSRIQMKPASKSGFCYIGEDRGFRSCIEVGEGDVCMSGNIFPTDAICINPNLRE
jgi:hypothetical protein